MTLQEIQRLIDARRYFYSGKVREAISDGFYSEQDLECCVLSAAGIYKKERDEKGEAVHGMKYVIWGRDTCGRRFYTAGKIVQRADGNSYFYITAHECDEER